MPLPTIKDGKWLILDVLNDLFRHGLEEVEPVHMEPISGPHGHPYLHLRWHNTDFLIEVGIKRPAEMKPEDMHELRYCVITMTDKQPGIIEAFTEIFEEPALGIYEKQTPTGTWVAVAEWEFENPHGRAQQLALERDRGELRKIKDYNHGHTFV